MSLVISSNLVLTEAELENPNAPRLCWRTDLSVERVSASSEEDDYPVTNVVNPSTAFAWQATGTGTEYIDLELTTTIDYVGIARHNIRAGGEVRLRAKTGTTLSTISDWTALSRTQQVVLWLLNEVSAPELRIEFRDNPEAPSVAVVYAGTATKLQRNIYVGHTPVTMGRQVQTIGGFSESGQYLGELIRREGRETTVTMENLTPSWYRDNLDPFLAQRPRRPAFFAWRPGNYESEVGYVWLTGSPQPENQRPNGMMSVTMDFEGIA